MSGYAAGSSPSGAPAKAVAASKAPVAAGGGRLMSLDALRGFDMLWIIGAADIVEALKSMSPNAVTEFLSTQLTHVRWAGLHFNDLIFPLFVFIMGVTTVFSLSKAMERNGRKGALLRLVRRCVLLILAGIFYYGGLSHRWPDIRVYGGVLEFLGITCFFAGVIYILLHRHPAVIAVIFGALIIGHWTLMAFVPFPDLRLDKKSFFARVAQVGSSDPERVLATVSGRVHGVYEEGYNLSNYLDYRYLPGRKENGAYENQGLLCTLGSVASCLLGVLAGLWLRCEKTRDSRKVLWLFAAGVVSILLGCAVALQFPVVKWLWSPSFVLVAGGYSALILGLFYAIIDIWRMRRWCQPFVWIGMNAITVYLACNIVNLPEMSARLAGGDLQHFFDGHVVQGFGSVFMAIVELALLFALARFLYVRKVFIRL